MSTMEAEFSESEEEVEVIVRLRFPPLVVEIRAQLAS